MEPTALPIFEIGVLLLLAALAGWLARRLRLPAIVGYLAVGLLVSPFTPGYVANHEQLQLLADGRRRAAGCFRSATSSRSSSSWQSAR